MDDENDRRVAREPEVADVVKICRSLNENGARYALIGGFALIAHGGTRTTKDIDLLVDPSPTPTASRWRCSTRSAIRSVGAPFSRAEMEQQYQKYEQ